MVNPKEIEDQLAVIERRVKALVAENRGLRDRIVGLEREIAGVRSEAVSRERMAGVTHQVRERIEKVLSSLEALGAGNNDVHDRDA
ncbi:MAG TPA: hypothetical protein VK654_03945 [Nitrospirota bacterium]|nr:hypothetical protein [Nitrospirota bacterium]